MVDLKTVVTEVRDALVSELGEHLLALYLFGSVARGEYVPGRSDVDLLLVVDPKMPLVAARNVFRPLWKRHAEALGHGPLIATPDDLALHMALFPSLHRVLLSDARRIGGEALLKRLPAPAPSPGLPLLKPQRGVLCHPGIGAGRCAFRFGCSTFTVGCSPLSVQRYPFWVGCWKLNFEHPLTTI